MLVRLEHALNYPDLAKQMMLVPKATNVAVAGQINLMIAYNGSARSQTALDLTLWIAHQTRLVTPHPVTVQVVYVVDNLSDRPSPADHFSDLYATPMEVAPDRSGKTALDFCDRQDVAELALSQVTARSLSTLMPDDCEVELSGLSTSGYSPANQIQQFEKADRILWQARHLADEWRGSLETHLRFGNLIEELRLVSRQVTTTALILGCSSPLDPIVQALGHDLPFPILGIPPTIMDG
jgi:hypothetical protein